MSIRVEIDGNLFDSIDKELAKLEAIDRAPALVDGISDALGAVADYAFDTLPKPGYDGDKPELKPLRETLEEKVIQYQEGKIVGVLGFDYPGGGQHGHLVESGHRMVTEEGEDVGFVEGGHYLENAAIATESQQEAAVMGGVETAIAAATH